MAYDPNWPQNGQLIDGDRFREQFAAIIDLIQAGGGGVSGATVDSVTTGNPGDPATAGVALVGATLHFTFAIPAGMQGPPGADGGPGNDGDPGPQGPQGPPFAEAVVDSVTTLNPGEPATVDVFYDGGNVHFDFGIPAGWNGGDGSPGEVSTADLNAAIETTSPNTNGVETLDSPFADPDVESLRQKLNEVILNGRR